MILLRKLAATSTTLALLGLNGLAAQTGAAKTTAFIGDLGFVNVSGNTSVTSFNVGNKLTMQTVDGRFTFTQTSGLVYGKTNGNKSAESYRFQLRGEYNLGARLYALGSTGWDRNAFAGISRRFEETIGLGYKVLTLPQDQLRLEAGLSLFQQRNTFAPAGTSLDDNYKAGRLGAAYKHTFSKTTSFSQSLEFFPNFDTSEQWRLNSESAFLAPVSSKMAFKAGYVIRYDNLPPFISATSTDRLKKSDRFITMGITLSF